MPNTIDLNCDLGEGAGHDDSLMPWITSANIACGAHAGNLETMVEAIECAAEHGVAIGAHPGFFDLENFGRTERVISPEEAGRIVLMQIEQFFEVAGTAMRHVKLHGALYNQVSRDAGLADAVAADLARLWPNIVLFALSGSQLAKAGKARGLRVAEEVFADRRYQRDGSLTPRSRPDAMIDDPAQAVARIIRLAREGELEATDGTILRLNADTVCVHGDGSKAVVFARRLNSGLKKAGIAIESVRP